MLQKTDTPAMTAYNLRSERGLRVNLWVKGEKNVLDKGNGSFQGPGVEGA